MGIAKKELDDQTDLVNRGLSRRPILFPIEARIAEAEAKKRQLQSDLLRSQQDVARADQTMIELRTNRRTEILTQLKETQENLEQIQRKIAAAGSLARNSETEVQRHSGEAQPVYSILRRAGAGLRELTASETTPIEPGDIVRIVLSTRDRTSQAGTDADPRAANLPTQLTQATR